MTRKHWLVLFLFLALKPAFAKIEQQLVDTTDQFNVPVVNVPEKEIVSCENIVHQIHNDIVAWPTTSANQYLPWMSMTWLKDHLGSPQNANIRDYVYVWKNFSLFVGADGVTEKIGSLPNQMQIKTPEEITRLMGKPRKIYSEQLNLYQWICPVNVNFWIAMLTKKDNTSIGIMGSDCNNITCEKFSSSYAESEIKHKFNQQMKEQTELSLNLLARRLNQYNDYFKTSFQNQTQLTEDILARIKLYYSSLRQCKKGLYQYVVPVLQDFLYQTSTIDKQAQDDCLIVTSYRIPNIGKVTLKCKIPLQNLVVFSDGEAESAARGFSQIDSDLQKLLNSTCKRYIGGVL